MRVNILQSCFDLLWPRRCEFCDKQCDRPSRHICSDCLNRVPFVSTTGCCRVCGRSVEGLESEYLCEDCSGKFAPEFDRAASAVRFEGEARRAILDYKFNRHLWLKDDFVDWLEGAARARFKVEEVDAVIAMPSTFFHRADRGYNQCAALAAGLAKRLDRLNLCRVLKRVGSPERQGGLDEEERRENVKDTFEVRRPELVRGRTLLVVDDIMTTGSTLSECAKSLKSAGASRIWCVTLARSLRN